MAVDWSLGQTDPLGAFQRGYTYADQIRQSGARVRAGRTYAAGDTKGAVNTLAASGNIEEAEALRGSAERRQGTAVDDQVKRFEAQHGFMQKIAPFLKAALDQGGPAAAVQAYTQYAAPQLKGLGVPDEVIAANADQFQKNPQGAIAALSMFAEAKIQNSGDDIVGFNQQTGEQLFRIRGEPTLRDRQAQANADRSFEATTAQRAQTQANADRTFAQGERRIEATESRGAGRFSLMTPDEKKAAGLPTESAYQVNGNGQITRVAGNTSVRPIPSSALAGIQSNRRTLTKIDSAIAALEKNPGAIGMKAYAGDMITQRLDPGGVSVRALVADVGSQKLHDRSGAAVTLSEAPRLQPFIPSVHDRADAAIAKLRNLRAEYEASTDEAEAFYSPEAGYMSLPSRGANPSPGNSGGKEMVGRFVIETE